MRCDAISRIVFVIEKNWKKLEARKELSDLPAVPTTNGAYTPFVVYCDRTVPWVLRPVHCPCGVDRIWLYIA